MENLQSLFSLLLVKCILILLSTTTLAQTMKSQSKVIEAYGIKYQKLPKKDRTQYMAMVLKIRHDLSSFENYTECYELIDGSILEIFVYDVPNESVLRLYKNESDYKLKLQNVLLNQEKNKKYNGRTTFEIIALKADEISVIEKEHTNILSESLKIEFANLNHSKESLKLLDKRFMRITKSEEYDDNPLYKALLYYFAVMLKNNLPQGEILFDMDSNNVVSRIKVLDEKKQVYYADIDIFEIWTEGPMINMEFNEPGQKKKKGRLTLDILFNTELNKYKHVFPSKPSNMFRQE